MKTGLFFIGASFGMIAGALLVNNNFMARKMLRDTQDKISSKIREKANGYRYKMEVAKEEIPTCGCGCWTEDEIEELLTEDEIEQEIEL